MYNHVLTPKRFSLCINIAWSLCESWFVVWGSFWMAVFYRSWGQNDDPSPLLLGMCRTKIFSHESLPLVSQITDQKSFWSKPIFLICFGQNQNVQNMAQIDRTSIQYLIKFCLQLFQPLYVYRKIIERPSISWTVDLGPFRAISAYSKIFLLYKDIVML